MTNNDLNILMGTNLRKLRLEHNLTQEQLADRLQVSSCLITKWETGSKGIGKRLLLKLCKAFNVKPCRFYADEKTPYLTSSRERDIFCMLREAEKAGVVDQIELFTRFIVNQVRKENLVVNKNSPTESDLLCARRKGKTVLSERTV